MQCVHNVTHAIKNSLLIVYAHLLCCVSYLRFRNAIGFAIPRDWLLSRSMCFNYILTLDNKYDILILKRIDCVLVGLYIRVVVSLDYFSMVTLSLVCFVRWEFLYWLYTLLLLIGDIEHNPGPSNYINAFLLNTMSLNRFQKIRRDENIFNHS